MTLETVEQYKALIEDSKNVFAHLDESGIIQFVSPSVEQMLGYSSDELVGEPASDLIHPDDRGRIAEAFDQIIEFPKESPERHEHRVRNVNGSWIWAESIMTNKTESALGGYVINSRNITERKLREREFEEYETIVKTIPVGVFVIDEKGVIRMGNERGATMVGYDYDELLDEPFQTLVDDGVYPPELMDKYLERIKTLLSAETDRDNVQFEQSVTVDGEERIFEIHLALRPFEDDFRGTIGIVRDATAEKRQQRALQRQNDRLEEFVSIVSHDIRNPLNVASGRLELARDQYEDEHLETVARAHGRIEELIDDLLTLARTGQQVGDLDSLDMAAMTETAWQTVETGEATLLTDIEGAIRADRSRLLQLLENLIRNAVEHGGEDVTVTAGQLADGFYVEDDGPGIPAEERDKVFETGYSTSTEGTGFGLSIVKQVVNAHDWDVHVTEGRDGGARLEITGVEFDQ